MLSRAAQAQPTSTSQPDQIDRLSFGACLYEGLRRRVRWTDNGEAGAES